MKRSEAVQKLKNRLMEIDALEPSVRYEKAADLLLQYMEELGIMPPFANSIFQKNAKIFIDPSGNEWEPEND